MLFMPTVFCVNPAGPGPATAWRRRYRATDEQDYTNLILKGDLPDQIMRWLTAKLERTLVGSSVGRVHVQVGIPTS